MMMREQQWDRSNCRHFRIDVCLHQRIYMRAFVNARNYHIIVMPLAFELACNLVRLNYLPSKRYLIRISV